jgi:hypothetical protein
MRIIGMDIHRVSAEVVSFLDGKVTRLGRVSMQKEELVAFAQKELTHDDHVVIEATGNATCVTELLSPYVDRVVIANPKQVHMIAHAKTKTEKRVAERQRNEVAEAEYANFTSAWRTRPASLTIRSVDNSSRPPCETFSTTSVSVSLPGGEKSRMTPRR